MSRRPSDPLVLPRRGWRPRLHCRVRDRDVRLTDRSRGRALTTWAITGFFALMLAPSGIVLVTLVNPPPARPGDPAPGSVLLGLVIINAVWLALGAGLLAALRLHRRFTVEADAERGVCVVRSRLFGLTRHRVEVPLDGAAWDVGVVRLHVPPAATTGGVILIVLSLLTGPLGLIFLLARGLARPRGGPVAPGVEADGVGLTLFEEDAERVRLITGDEQAVTAFLAAWDDLTAR